MKNVLQPGAINFLPAKAVYIMLPQLTLNCALVFMSFSIGHKHVFKNT